MTETAIVNIALGRAQISARLTDYATDTGKEARAARDAYESIRDNMLRKYLWSFAKKRVELAEVVTVPAFGRDRAFALPADFLRAISVHPSDSDWAKIRYKLETVEVSGSDARVIVTDATQLFLRYVAKQTNTSLMDPMFREALSWDLAKHFALVVKESTTQAEYCGKELRAALNEAKAANAIEDWPEEFPAGSWLNERFVEGDTWYGDIYS